MPEQRNTPDIRYTHVNSFARQYYYHKILNLPLWGFLVLVTILFFGVNTFFALLYMACSSLMNVVHPEMIPGLGDSLYFSMTFPVVGYGGLAPVGIGRLISVVQVFCGLLYLGTLTGLIFTRFSRTPSPLVWSTPVVIYKEGKDTLLQVRFTNVIGNDVVNVFPKLYVQRNVRNTSGEMLRTLTPVPLQTDVIPIAAFSWILSHKVTLVSPVRSWVLGKAQGNERLVGFIYGHDATTGNDIFSYAKWQPADLVHGSFENVIKDYSETTALQAKVEIDLKGLDTVRRSR